MKLFNGGILAVALMSAGAANHAQSKSAGDIAAIVDQRMGELDEYAVLLNNPDRALSAMQIIIGLEDPQISRIALQHALTSTSSAVRKAAVKGYLHTQPNRKVLFEGSAVKLVSFTQRLSAVSGSVGSEGNGFLTYQIGAFDEGKGCYVFAGWPNQCYVTRSESTVIVTMWRRAAPFSLDEIGSLLGEVLFVNLAPAAPATIPIGP